MLTEKEIKHLQEGFNYLEEYDKLLDFPDKKVKINWITNNLGTASLKEMDKLKKIEDIEIELVIDLIDGKQINKGQFSSKIIHIEKSIKQGKKVVVICRGGQSRSNAVALAYLLKGGINFDEAYSLVKRKVPIMRIRPDLLDFVKNLFKGR